MIARTLGRGGRPLRIAYARLFHEGNAFSPVPTTQQSFERFHVHAGSALADKCTLRGHELEGFLRHAELTGFVQAARAAGDVEAVPLFSAMTVPSGRLTAQTFAWLRARLQEELQRALADGPLDGVFLALHGSMQVQDLSTSPEGAIIADVARLAPAAKIGASFDLHGNLTSEIVDPLTALSAYRTNPHRDLLQAGWRCGNRLIRALRGHTRPVHAWRKLPMLLGGGTTIDLLTPMRQVFARMRKMERDPRVLGAHLFMVHPYSHAEGLGWAVHVTCDDDARLAEQLADELADEAFATRDHPLPDFLAPQAALQEVKNRRLATKTGTVSLVDTSDIVGAGAPGGNTRVLEALLERPDELRVYVPVHDPAAVAACAAVPVGQAVDLRVAGIPSEAYPQPTVQVRGTLSARVDNESGTVVRVDVGKVSVALTDRLPLTISPRFWRELGLSPWEADAIVQKMFFHYRFFYAAVNRANIGVVTSGSTSLDNITRLPTPHPMWPNAAVTDWRAFDAATRRPAAVS